MIAMFRNDLAMTESQQTHVCVPKARGNVREGLGGGYMGRSGTLHNGRGMQSRIAH